MKAMILAAGLGTRMRPLTDTTPKPLLPVADKALIQYHIEALARAGVHDIVVNTAWLGEQVQAFLGDGSRFGVSVVISDEGAPLETAGGVCRALPLLGDEPFLLVNGDIWTDYDFSALARHSLGKDMAHLVLVPNPPQHPEGDFALGSGRVASGGEQKATFAGISLLRPQLFKDLAQGAQRLAPLLFAAADQAAVSGEFYQGLWFDIGTPRRLDELDLLLRNKAQNQ